MALKLIFNPFTSTLDFIDEVPVPDDVGQVLHSRDGTTFKARTPLTSNVGWLVNDEGHLLVVED